MNAADVTAVLVTRGDQPEFIGRIIDSLIFPNIVVWDNSVREDRKTAGRYYALLEAEVGDIVYFQDDDCLVPAETQQQLVDAYQPGVMVANWGHGADADGLDDLPFVCGGGVCDRSLPWPALERYLAEYPLDNDFLYEADFIVGILYPSFRHLYLPFEIELAIAQHPSRLTNQPWQKTKKHEITARARAIRDRERVAA